MMNFKVQFVNNFVLYLTLLPEDGDVQSTQQLNQQQQQPQQQQ